MPSVIKSKFMHAQRFLRRAKILFAEESSQYKRNIEMRKIIDEAKAVGFTAKWIIAFLNKNIVNDENFETRKRIEKRILSLKGYKWTEYLENKRAIGGQIKKDL